MPKVTSHLTLTLRLFTLNGEPALLIDSQGNLPADPAAYARLLKQVATALQRHARNIQQPGRTV